MSPQPVQVDKLHSEVCQLKYGIILTTNSAITYLFFPNFLTIKAISRAIIANKPKHPINTIKITVSHSFVSIIFVLVSVHFQISFQCLPKGQ